MTIQKQLENILDQYPYLSNGIFGSVQERQAVLKLMRESYELGIGKLNFAFPKSEKDNPYHIDYERQGNLFDDNELTGV